MSARRPIHLNPATDVAERVLLPGDPQRALAVAQALLEGPKMLNARRGLWGYTGIAPDGDLLTVQSSGIGGPSAAIVTEELIDLGARTLLRIGTCGALSDAFEMGRLLAVRTALAYDGASRALGAADRVEADAELLDALVSAGGATPATVVSTDLFYDPREHLPGQWVAEGAVAVEMEAAAIFSVARSRGARAGCLLAVTDLLAGGRKRMDQDSVEAVGVELGAAALRALEALSPR
ncbi:MAG: purine-nucleoside phosphorylase [Thermoleophilaceae bacterium]|jgi:uridine phosphorylase|nr:purine-nucleoside phosphorylase [Thermoleophilaceae bacterium]